MVKVHRMMSLIMKLEKAIKGGKANVTKQIKR